MTTTPHPVDSTLHTCCNAIGQHAQDCYEGLFAGPLSPREALELARALVAAVDEAQERAEAVAQ